MSKVFLLQNWIETGDLDLDEQRARIYFYTIFFSEGPNDIYIYMSFIHMAQLQKESHSQK